MTYTNWIPSANTNIKKLIKIRSKEMQNCAINVKGERSTDSSLPCKINRDARRHGKECLKESIT